MWIIALLLIVQAVVLALAAAFDDGDLTARQRILALVLAFADVAAVVHVL